VKMFTQAYFEYRVIRVCGYFRLMTFLGLGQVDHHNVVYYAAVLIGRIIGLRVLSVRTSVARMGS